MNSTPYAAASEPRLPKSSTHRTRPTRRRSQSSTAPPTNFRNWRAALPPEPSERQDNHDDGYAVPASHIFGDRSERQGERLSTAAVQAFRPQGRRQLHAGTRYDRVRLRKLLARRERQHAEPD